MKALGLSVFLVLAGVLCVALGLFGLAPADAMAMTGMVLLAMGVMTAFIHVIMDGSRGPGRRGRRFG